MLRTADKTGGEPPVRQASRLTTGFAFISLRLSHHPVPGGCETAIVAQTPPRDGLPHLPIQEGRGGRARLSHGMPMIGPAGIVARPFAWCVRSQP